MSKKPDEHLCMSCFYALWSRTAVGRLHPGGWGVCRWKYEPTPVASAFYWPPGTTPRPSGGTINRTQPITFCPKHLDQRSADVAHKQKGKPQ